MQEFDYELVYKPGTTNRIADPLSRMPDTGLNVTKTHYGLQYGHETL